MMSIRDESDILIGNARSSVLGADGETAEESSPLSFAGFWKVFGSPNLVTEPVVQDEHQDAEPAHEDRLGDEETR
jgi:hypothetical protein